MTNKPDVDPLTQDFREEMAETARDKRDLMDRIDQRHERVREKRKAELAGVRARRRELIRRYRIFSADNITLSAISAQRRCPIAPHNTAGADFPLCQRRLVHDSSFRRNPSSLWISEAASCRFQI